MATVDKVIKKKKEIELTVDDDTEATVSKTMPSGERAVFKATVSQKEVEVTEDLQTDDAINFDDFDTSEADLLPFQESPYQAIEKAPLGTMFDDINYAIEQGCHDRFFAWVVRLPDPISNNFRVSNTMAQQDLGQFQFTSRDMFNFVNAVQKINNNSGGVFSIAIYTDQQKPLTFFKRFRGRFESEIIQREITVGLANYSVPNPDIAIDGNNANTSMNQGNDLKAILEQQQKSFEHLLEKALGNKQPSALEQAMERKLIDDMVNPKTMDQTAMMQPILTAMAGMFAMPQMVQGFAGQMFPQPTPPAEKTLIDHVEQALQIPAVQNALIRIGDIGEAMTVKRLGLQSAENPDDDDLDEIENPTEKTDMQLLMEMIITELESDRPLDDTNSVIINLQETYPDQYDELQTTCQTLHFDAVFALLQNRMAKMKPSPLVPFIDIAQAQAGKIVYNERGEKLKVRLEAFYNFVRGPIAES